MSMDDFPDLTDEVRDIPEAKERPEAVPRHWPLRWKQDQASGGQQAEYLTSLFYIRFL